MSGDELPRTPTFAKADICRMNDLASEADELMGCVHDRYMTGQRKREALEESKLKLIEIRSLLVTLNKSDLAPTEFVLFRTGWRRFDFLRESQQEIEDFLYGRSGGPFRSPIIQSLDFEEEEREAKIASPAADIDERTCATAKLNASIVEPRAPIDLGVGPSTDDIADEDDSALLSWTDGVLERTLPMLWLDEQVLTDYIPACGEEYDNSYCLSVASALSQVFIPSEDCCCRCESIDETTRSRKRKKTTDI